jgi:hypothetical protein
MHNPCDDGWLCQLSSTHNNRQNLSNGKRIFIPQERVIIERPIPPKVEPALIALG